MKREHAFWFSVAGLACGVAGLVFLKTEAAMTGAATILFGCAVSFSAGGLWIVALTKR